MTLEDFSSPFSIELYARITENLIGHEFSKDTRSIHVNPSFKYIKAIDNIGVFEELGLHLFTVKHTSEKDARMGLSKELFSVMKEYSFSNALVATYSNDGNWRYSLLTSNLKVSKDGKVIRQFSNPKRYSYMLGPHAKTVTPYKFLVRNGKVSDFSDLKKRFSVEVVNNDFYGEISQLYDELVGVDSIPMTIVYPESSESTHQFAVRLIGRIIFCWFLREKRSSKGVPLINKNVLSRDAAEQSGYYHNTLAPLFFEVLNKPIAKRSLRFQQDGFGEVPYLNGGLFAPQSADHYMYDSDLELSVEGAVNIPDVWLRKLFDLLELYNFTVDENTSVDIDLSIDPEMLGRIFENLLARINPETGETVRNATGSFYTPREIVEYMVDRSLVEYLRKTHIDENKLNALVSYNIDDDTSYPLDDSEKKTIIEALHSAKILDPACGSGAFPIGILQKIVFMLQQIDPEAKLWFENQIRGTAPEVRDLIEREFEHKNFDYIRKLGIIRESIFGIDIQPIATEIARLRCFLTLIVDERVDDNESNRGIYPLPNLDFKFVTANTLIKLDVLKPSGVGQTGLFEDQSGIRELKALRDDYFNSHSSEREMLKLKFLQAQNRMLQNMIANHSHGISDVTQRLSTWDPFSHMATGWFDTEWMFGISDGFDIVIGNPPYFVYQGHIKEEIPQIKSIDIYQKAQGGKLNAYKLFLAFAPSVLKENGITAFIFQNSFLADNSAKKIRQFYLTNQRIISIDSFPERDNAQKRVFESVKMSVCVMISRNSETINDYAFELNVWSDKHKSEGYTTSFTPDELITYDSIATPIPYLKQQEKKVFSKCFNNRNEGVISCYEGELNMTFHRDYFTALPTSPKVIKGAQVQRYRLTDELSQGVLEFVDANKYLADYSKSKKSRHHEKTRIAMQGITGVDDKRRFVMSVVPAGIFCANSCNYILINDQNYTDFLVLGLFNSYLFNWLFKKTSTNSNVNCYEIENLPIPKIIGYEDVAEEISRCAEELSVLYARGDEKNAKSETLVMEERLDSYVYKLFRLNADEIAIIEGAK